MTSSSTGPAPSLLYAVKRLELAIRANLDEMLRESGVTTLQYTALTVLEHRDGVTAAHLARGSFVTPQAMADMIRALEHRNLIRRSTNPDNKRELLVYLTADGRRLLKDHASAAADVEARMTSDLSRAQTEAFRRALTSAWATLSRAGIPDRV